MKFCPSCGSGKFRYNGERSFSCPECSFVYYINSATAAVVIIEAPDGRIALTRRKNDPKAGYLDLPGGFVDIMESAEEAIIREIREELGITVKDLRYIGSAPNEYLYKGISYFTCDVAFVCTSDELGKMKPADDVSEVFLIKPEEIDRSKIGFPSAVTILDIYMETRRAI